MKQNEVIATCSAQFNNLTLSCTNVTTEEDLVCWIQDCPNKEGGKNLIPSYIFFSFGIPLSIIGAIMTWTDDNVKSSLSYLIVGVYMSFLGSVTLEQNSSKQAPKDIFFDFLFVIVAIIVGTVFFTLRWIAEKKKKKAESDEEGTNIHHETSSNEKPAEQVELYTAEDVYLDITTKPFTRIVATFLCQGALLILYYYVIFTEDHPDFTKLQTYFFFGLGAAIQLISKGGATFRQAVIVLVEKQLFQTFSLMADAMDLTGQSDVSKGVLFQYTFRVGASIIINHFGTLLLLFILPYHLAQSESAMDFVLNAIAAYFIVELDDLKEGKKIFGPHDLHQTKLEDGTALLVGPFIEDNESPMESEESASSSNIISAYFDALEIPNGDAFPLTLLHKLSSGISSLFAKEET